MTKRQLILSLMFLPGMALASPIEEPRENRIPILDTVQELFGARANFAANRFDSFFATDRADDEFGRSRVRIRTFYTLRDRTSGDHTTQYRINLKIPHLEEKFRYDYYQDEKDPKKKKKDDKNAPEHRAFARSLSNKEELERLRDSKIYEGWIFNSDISVTTKIPPAVLTRARVRKNFVTGDFINRFTEQVSYATDERGLVNELTLQNDYSFNEDLLFRFVNFVRWQIGRKNFITQTGPTLLQRLTENDALNYRLVLESTIQNQNWFVDNYSVSIDYRRNLYKQWVYFDFIPGIDFPKHFSFSRNPFIIVQLEFLFGS